EPPRLGHFPEDYKPAFDWLVHLDRELVSPMELLHVSAYKPHELTQQFVTNGKPFGHYAPWFDENNRLYRLFEFVECHGRMSGASNVNLIGNPGVEAGQWATVTLTIPPALRNSGLLSAHFGGFGNFGGLGPWWGFWGWDWTGNDANNDRYALWGGVIDAGTPQEERLHWEDGFLANRNANELVLRCRF